MGKSWKFCILVIGSILNPDVFMNIKLSSNDKNDEKTYWDHGDRQSANNPFKILEKL